MVDGVDFFRRIETRTALGAEKRPALAARLLFGLDTTRESLGKSYLWNESFFGFYPDNLDIVLQLIGTMSCVERQE